MVVAVTDDVIAVSISVLFVDCVDVVVGNGDNCDDIVD